jgi:hypothetical protein
MFFAAVEIFSMSCHDGCLLFLFLRLSFLCGAGRRFRKQECAGGGAYNDDSKIKHAL